MWVSSLALLCLPYLFSTALESTFTEALGRQAKKAQPGHPRPSLCLSEEQHRAGAQAATPSHQGNGNNE